MSKPSFKRCALMRAFRWSYYFSDTIFFRGVNIQNTESHFFSVFEKNVFEQKNLEAGTIVARAFKPIQSVFEIVTKNFKNFKNLILFLGKNGKQTLLDASKVWEFEYKERKSVTSDDSLILNIKKIRKKI